MVTNYWNKKAETMSREGMRALQGNRLASVVRHTYNNVPAYRKKMENLGLEPGDIRCIEDISKLPFVDKYDLADNYPYGLFAVPMSEIVEIHASSGTTGKQKVLGYTRHDLEIWGEVMARTLAAGGTTSSDIFHCSYGYGLFTGGLGAHYGSQTIGCTTVPVGTGNTNRQIQIIRDFGCTAICCTPSYMLYIAETLEQMKVDPSEVKLRRAFLGAEPWTIEMRDDIERRLPLRTYDIYGLTEMIGPGVAFECDARCGLHVNEDHFYPEIVDPDTLKPVEDGIYGELVFSTLTKEGMPLLRYRTRDIASITHETCECGRTLARITKPKGRTDDMLIIRGVNVFPSQVESVLLGVTEASPYYFIIVDRVGARDTFEIQVELTEGFPIDEVRAVEKLQKRIGAAIESALGIGATIRLLPPHSLPRVEGKARHVEDRRNLK
ncbi:MAG: phenylacetate--CoA ligase [Ruminococcaceae bacterium]|nr:phenylacetate--CoA ligase [Oscillospiraceae bacterium]